LGDAADVWDLVDNNLRYDIILHDMYIPGAQLPAPCSQKARLTFAFMLQD
jgi:hypothetical protein